MLAKAMEELLSLFAGQSARTERMVEKSVQSLLEKNEKFAREVIEIDEADCNRVEKEIESKAVEILTLFSPKATDMRKVIAIIKANLDLERIGDQSVNIAEHSIFLMHRLPVKPLIDIPRMAIISREMMNLALNAFLQDKIDLATQCLRKDNEVDALNEQIIRELITYMASDPSLIERSMRLIFITRNLERIGDLATNLAEEVTYYLTGEDIRHPGNKTFTNGERR